MTRVAPYCYSLIQTRKEAAVKTPQQIIEIYSQGWDAMEWLARHSKSGGCRECANYHRRVEQGGKPTQLVTLRCRLAQVQHRKYMAVKHMRLELTDDFECDLKDGKTSCEGRAEWALATREIKGRRAGERQGKGALLSFQIGCLVHVEKAEHRAVVAGNGNRVTIEKLEDVVREGADKMA